jgi:hypothetical protein
MKKLLTALLLAAFGFGCTAAPNSNSSRVSEPVAAKTAEQSNQTVPAIDKTTGAWDLKETENSYLVTVSRTGRMPNGLIQALFLIRCAKTENTNSGFEFIVSDAAQFPYFNFDYFEGPNAPAQKKKTVTIATSKTEPKLTSKSSVKLTWKFAVSGSYGCNADAKSFCFTENLENVPNPLPQVAKYIADGGFSTTVTVSDNQNEIKSEFPPIDPASEAAKVLKTCRF